MERITTFFLVDLAVFGGLEIEGESGPKIMEDLEPDHLDLVR